MDHIAVQIILLLVAIAGWALCAIPMLRYMIDMTEGRFRWQLVMWLALMVTSIFVMKFALYSLAGWPQPSTWASRLFFGFVLVLSFAVPFIWEMLKGAFRKR